MPSHRFRARPIWSVLCTNLLIVGCQPFVPVVDLNTEAPSEVAASTSVAIYRSGSPAPRPRHVLGTVSAYSCKYLLWDPPATRKDATDQLKLKAHRMGADAVVEVAYDDRFPALATNCWQTIEAKGQAVRLR